MYRINICVEDGTVVGRQDRELDRATFESIVTGARPQGDGDAHTRDSSMHGGQNRTCYYHSIWNPVTMSWVANQGAEQVDQLMTDCFQERFGG